MMEKKVMKMGLWMVLFLLAGSCVCASARRGGFSGTLMDGTPDYSDEAFARMEQLGSRLTEENQNDLEVEEMYENAFLGLIQPNGPLEGVRIVLRSGSEAPEDRETTSDENGKFRFDHLAMGEYTLTVHKTGVGLDSPGKMSWRIKIKDEHRYARGRMIFPSEFITAKGRVTGSSGKPLAGIHISAEEYRYNGELGRWSPVTHTVKAVTDEEGRYELPGLHPTLMWPGDGGSSGYLLRIEGEGFASCIRKIDVVMKNTLIARQRLMGIFRKGTSPREQQKMANYQWPTPADAHGVIAGVDFRMTTAATLGGCVRDEAGKPISKASLWLVPGADIPKPPSPLNSQKGTNSNESGHYSFDGLAPGHYHIAARAKGYAKQKIPFEVSEGEMLELPVVMKRAGAVVVDVVRNGKHELPSFLAVMSLDGGFHSFWPKQTNEQGYCKFKGLPPGENRLRAVFKNGKCRRIEDVWVSIEADATNHVELVVDGKCAFDVDLPFPKGGGARVWVNPVDAPVVDNYWRDQNRKGDLWIKYPERFSFEGFPAGEYRVSLQYFNSSKEMKFDTPWKAVQVKTVLLVPGEKPVVSFEF